jgi:magnesium-transporting ATPase (P-type)
MSDEGDRPIERQEYLDERQVLLECRNNAVRSLEKTLVTLSAGALALSITFLHDIAPHPTQITWMIIAWILLFGSLALMLTVFILGVHVFEKDIDALGKEYQKQEVSRPEKLISSLKWLEWSSLAAFILGSIFFAVFATVNLPK